MAWAEPQYTREEVNSAAKKWLAEEKTFEEHFACLEVINNWRGIHAFPLNTFQMGLRKRGQRIDKDTIVAQRIKRLSSIELKLQIHTAMKLSQMQDIGGCRAIVTDLKSVKDLSLSYKESEIKHRLLTEDDYITSPRNSGYRGIHLVYSYFSDRKETYNGLKIEIQMRSQLQHAWATAVEVVGMMVDQALKSSLGDKQWLRFFQLMSSEIARIEKTRPVPGTPESLADTRKELMDFVNEYDPVNRLYTYRNVIDSIEPGSRNDHFYILHLIPNKNKLRVIPFNKNQSVLANEEYLRIEKNLDRGNNEEAVLVSVDSIYALKKAYPNYFLDTEVFSGLVNRSIRLARRY